METDWFNLAGDVWTKTGHLLKSILLLLRSSFLRLARGSKSILTFAHNNWIGVVLCLWCVLFLLVVWLRGLEGAIALASDLLNTLS